MKKILVVGGEGYIGQIVCNELVDKNHEVISYDNFIKFGSEQICRENGKLSVEGKDYVVNDGDIMHFRFNV